MTAHDAAKTHCPKGHPYSGDNLMLVKRGRVCRQCNRERNRRYGATRVDGPEAKAKRIAKDRLYRQRQEAKARAAARSRVRAKDPAQRHKWEARWELRRAIAAGRVTRQPCEKCGAPKAHGHHDDYSRPLEVRWLCPQHHAEHHAQERQ